jgi:succinoglycan biosynthesis protein ExoA
MVAIGQGCFQTAASTAQNSRIGTGGSAHRSIGESLWVDHGHHALMRLDFFRKIAGYDPRFSHNEDAEYDMRLTRAGGRIWLDSKLPLDYLPRQTPTALGRQYLNYGRGRARTVRLHRLKLKTRQAAPLAVLPALLLATAAVCLAPFTSWALLGVLPSAAWAAICLLAGLALGLRSQKRCAAMAGVAAMIMHAAWSWGFWQEILLRRRLETRPAGGMVSA